MLPLSPQIALIANGEIVSYDKTKKLLALYKKVIAVDGGLEHCEKMGICPCLIVGDLDSISEKTLQKYATVPMRRYPRKKDQSDLELAVQELLDQDSKSLALFGVLGKRADHLLYTLYLLTRYPTKLVIESEDEIIFCLEKQNHVAAFPGQTISLIPLGQVFGITTQGLQWELNKAIFDKKFMSLSNICLENSFRISIQSGDLLCCMQKKIV